MKFQAVLVFLCAVAYGSASITDLLGTPAAGSRLAKAKNGLETAGMVIKEARAMWERNKVSDIVETEQIPYHCTLAASYGNLSTDALKTMDDELKIMIAGTNKLMRQLRIDNPTGNITFRKYVSVMKQNHFVTSDDTEDVVRSEYIGFGKIRLAQNSVDQSIVDQVVEWFENDLIQDQDVLAATRIDIVDYGNIAGLTGATVDSLESLVFKSDYAERSVVDVGVLRYPDLEQPFFKLFRIQLFAFRRSDRVLFVQKDASGIKGLYQSKIFRPNKTIMSKLKDSIRKKAINAAEGMFEPQS